MYKTSFKTLNFNSGKYGVMAPMRAILENVSPVYQKL